MSVQPVEPGCPEKGKDHLLERRFGICRAQDGALPVDRPFVEDIPTGIPRLIRVDVHCHHPTARAGQLRLECVGTGGRAQLAHIEQWVRSRRLPQRM
jgi:hypothetical protein